MQKKLTQTKSIKDTNIKLRTIAFKITNDLLNADPNTYADTLHRVFGLIGQTIHVDRIYLFEYRFDEDRLLGICEWSNKGILPHIKNNLSVTIHQDLDMLIHHHQNKAYVALSDITTLNHDTYLYQVLSEQGVQSMVAYPVFTGDQLFGFVGIEDNKQKRVWVQDEINLFGILVQLIGNVLDKRQISNEKDQLHELVKMANQAKSDFLSNMSHEIKTPLSGIYNAIYLLGTAHLTPEQKQYLNMAQTSVDNLTGMINDVLDISMIEAGKMEIDNQLFNLEDELVKIVHMQSRLAQEKKLEIIFDFDYGINFMLLGDYLKLRKIMMNLFNNAIKYTNQGSITVKATRLEDDKKAKIEFKVIDTGIGIDEKHKHHLFDSFFQVDASISKKYAGAGLGLAISNHLVHLLGGSFSFESQPNHGSEFKVILSFDKGALHTYPSTHLLNARIITSETFKSNTQQMLESMGVSIPPMKEKADLIVIEKEIRDSKEIGEIKTIYGHTDAIVISINPRQNKSTQGFHHHFGYPVSRHAIQDWLMRFFNNTKDKRHEKEFHEIDYFGHALIVDDNKLNRVALDAILKKLGYSSKQASSGLEAIELIQKEKFDVVLMDIQMPGLDGYQTSGKIRSINSKFLSLPIIAVTANMFAGDEEHFKESKMDDVIFKPIKIDQLAHVLRKFSNKTYLIEIPKDLSVFDVNAFNHRFEGSQEIAKDVLVSFMAVFDQDLETIKKAVYDQDFDQILRSAHYLKGSASYVSGDRVVWILNQMMDQAKVKEQAFMNPYYDLLSDEMQTLHDSLQTHLKQLMKANG